MYSLVAPSFPEIIYTRVRVFLTDDFPTLELLQETLANLRAIFETHSVSPKGATLLGYGPPYTLLDVRGPYYDPDVDDDRFSAFQEDIGGEEYGRSQGYTGRLEMNVKKDARTFFVIAFRSEDDEDSDGNGSEEFGGSEIEQD